MNKIEFIKNIKKIFKNIPINFFEQIDRYKDFLQAYNQKINLTRLDDDQKVYGEYFFESIVPYKDVNFNDIKTILDIGSGSGIPGIVLKLLYPNIQLTIIESNNKKCIFLKELCEHLKINVSILNQRAEKILNMQREQFDLVTSRAVASLAVITELSLPYLKINGLLIEPKSKKWLEEITDTEKVIEVLGGELLPTNQFQSVNDKFHAVVVIKKIKKTSHLYPREWNLILKGFK